MMRVLPLLLLATPCAPTVARQPASPMPIEITYEAGPCFGTCPTYSVRIDSLGRPGVFDGQRFTAVTGRREFTTTYAQFENFYRALFDAFGAEAKAYESGGAKCREYATDHPSVNLTLREGDTDPKTVRFDLGCRDPQNVKLFADLRRAPTLLPIGDLIGKR